MWIWILIAAIVIGGIIGFIGSNDNERTEGALSGMIAGGMGCGHILLQLFIAGISILAVVWLFGALFGGCE